MGKQTLYQAPQGWLASAVETLCRAGGAVVAPTETEPGLVDLEPVTSAEEISLQGGNTRLPLKRLFLPVSEVLLEFEKGQDGDVDVRPEPLPSADDKVVVMGCRPCDAAALEALDKVFQWDYDDLRYRRRRERTTIVAFACAEPQAECFCTSVGGSPHDSRQSDALVFFGQGGEALVQVNTEKGEKLIKQLGEAVRPAAKSAKPPAPPQLQPMFDTGKIKRWLDENFQSEFWTETAMRCLGCGACSYLCPTCHCFDIVDEGTWIRGRRLRNWDCCSGALFTAHASGHNPRPDQASRCRQRVMHKFKYFPERFGQVACVGCGRCIRACGVGRRLTAILAEIESKA